jgi:2-keto-4-pentenoate hydratase
MQAHRMRGRFSPLDAERIGDLAFAYAVQDRLVSLQQDAGGGDIIGWKLGVTSARMQDMVGINQPIAGAILSSHHHRSGVELHLALASHSKLIKIDRAFAGANFCDFHRLIGFARG